MSLSLKGKLDCSPTSLRKLKRRVAELEGLLKIQKKKEEAKNITLLYKEKIEVYNIESKYFTSRKGKVAGVEFKLKNKSDKAIKKIAITFYFKDDEGNVISEEVFHPVFYVKDSFTISRNNKPLKAGYIWKQPKGKLYSADAVPSEWKEGSIDVEITEVVLLGNDN